MVKSVSERPRCRWVLKKSNEYISRNWRMINHLSGYPHWEQLTHAQEWLLFEKNIGAYICIDEVALSHGELYTILINKEAHGGKGSIIAIIKGTDVYTVSFLLLKLSCRRRYQVREITLNIASQYGVNCPDLFFGC